LCGLKRSQTNDLDGMVRNFVEAKLDACACDHWANLTDSLPDHHLHVWLRVRAGVSAPPKQRHQQPKSAAITRPKTADFQGGVF
jgi:hypothetical protein